MVEPAATAAPARGPLRARLAAPLGMAVALALFFAPALLTRGQLLYRDNGRMHWPVKQYLAQELRQGHLPQWNPYAGLGAPLVSGAIDAVQHPFGLLLVALPFELAFKLWALLSFALAASGAFAWARLLGRSPPAAAAAGLGFALSGALVGASDNLTYLTTLAAVPWVFAAAHRWLVRPGPGALAAVGLASFLCAAGGDPQAWGFAVALLPAYAATVAHRGPSRWRSALRGLAAAGAALAGAAPVILPVMAWAPHSSRGGGLDAAEAQRWNLPLQRLPELILPHLFRDVPGAMPSPVYVAFGGGAASPVPWVTSIYAGTSVVALALLAARGARPARWLLMGAAGFTWLALGPGGGLGWLLGHAPLLSGFRYWEKMAAWPALLLPMAAAFGVDALGAGGGGRRAGPALAGLGLLALLLQGALRAAAPGALAGLLQRPGVAAEVASSFAGNLLDGLLAAGLAALLLGLALLAAGRGLLRRAAPAVLALLVGGDLFANNLRGYLLADPAIVQRPAPLADALAARPGLQRVLSPFEPPQVPGLRGFEGRWLAAGHLLSSCFNLQHRIGNHEIYAGMVPLRADRFRRRLPFGALAQRVGLFGVGHLAVPWAPEAARAAGLEGPLEVVASDPALPAFLLRLPHRERAYLAGEVSSVDRRGAMEFALHGQVAGRGAVIEAPVPAGYRPPAGTARVAADEPERVALETESDGPALLVLNDTHGPGWTATVDGRPSAILHANYLARGVWVEGGAHRVEFRYRTPLLREGWAVLLLGAAALGVAAAVRRRRPP